MKAYGQCCTAPEATCTASCQALVWRPVSPGSIFGAVADSINRRRNQPSQKFVFRIKTRGLVLLEVQACRSRPSPTSYTSTRTVRAWKTSSHFCWKRRLVGRRTTLRSYAATWTNCAKGLMLMSLGTAFICRRPKCCRRGR